MLIGRFKMGELGVRPDPPPPLLPENHKNIGLHSNNCPDPLKNRKATKPAFNVGPLSVPPTKRHFFRLRAFTGIWILSLLINSIKNVVRFGPPPPPRQKILDPHVMLSYSVGWVCAVIQLGFVWSCLYLHSKEEGKDQESIQSSTEHHVGKWQNTRKHHIQESQEVSPFPAGDHKAAMNRQDRMTDTKYK